MEAIVGQPCGHIHDGTCGYVEAAEEISCDMDCNETSEDCQIIHGEDCGYVLEVEGVPCQHEHDGECGYIPADPGQPCGYVCPTCSMQAVNDLPTPQAGETDDFTVTGGALGTDYSYTDNALTVLSEAGLTISGNTTRDKIVIADGVTADVTLQNVSIDVGGTDYACAFKVAESAACNLTLNGMNTLKSGWYKAGLQVSDGAVLVIMEGSTGRKARYLPA